VHWGKLRVGKIRQFFDPAATDPDVLKNYNASIDLMAKAGAEIIELDFSLAELCLPAYYIITAAECSSNLARYDGIRFGPPPTVDGLLERYLEVRSGGIGEEVKRRILLGTYVLSAGYFDAYYDRARRLRADIRDQLLGLFQQADIIATPTSPTPAFRFGEKLADPVQMYLSDVCTAFVNLAGLAGISLPNGFAGDGGTKLPTGLQFACAPMRDHVLLRVAHQYEQLSGWKFELPEWIGARLAGQG
jgi:aspartyl-tRNA(Asn)/glutamyl-tRNA(Gln) amidotransferase subunit A